MSVADSGPGERGSAGADPPLTVELLADLQAGLLDGETAARIRRQVRSDPQAREILQAMNRVRCDIAASGADPTAAPEVPPAIIARVSATLRSAGSGRAPAPAHAARPGTPPARAIVGVAGLCAAVAAIGVGTVALVNAPTPAPSAAPTAEHITVSRPAPAIPLSPPQIRELLRRPADYGPPGSPVSDPARRPSCLSGLGYPASTDVLGARPAEINARPVILLVLPADRPDQLAVFAVASNCNAADTGLLASTVVART